MLVILKELNGSLKWLLFSILELCLLILPFYLLKGNCLHRYHSFLILCQVISLFIHFFFFNLRFPYDCSLPCGWGVTLRKPLKILQGSKDVHVFVCLFVWLHCGRILFILSLLVIAFQSDTLSSQLPDLEYFNTRF